jgi:anti-sigma regulatory factor (Ser/Thr protein kinase)
MRATRSFPSSAASVKKARRFIGQCLADVPPEVRDDVALLVSELATNAVRHSAAEFVVVADRNGTRIRVEVTDAGRGAPEPRTPSSDEPSGRGLRIVEALADDWGIDRGRRGTTVWFSTRLVAADRRSTTSRTS